MQEKESLLKNGAKKIPAGIFIASGVLILLVAGCLLMLLPDSQDEKDLKAYESLMGETYETKKEDGKTYIIIENKDSTEIKDMDQVRRELAAWATLEASGGVDVSGRADEPESEASAETSEKETEKTESTQDESETKKPSDEAHDGKNYAPGQITFQEYLSLTPDQQDQYVLACKNDPNYGLKKFIDWYNLELKKYNETTEAPTVIHPGDVIDFSPSK